MKTPEQLEAVAEAARTVMAEWRKANRQDKPAVTVPLSAALGKLSMEICALDASPPEPIPGF